MAILERISGPDDLKQLSIDELKSLSGEIRELIIQVVSKNGGHLSSNLGVVDLTIAVHRVFDSPRDKIVWDVGHQCYTHKILTGRRERMFSIRTQGGLMGYPDLSECEHDSCNVGHASTSLALGAGMAVARDRSGADFHIAAVIGDGALTGGVALEAINHIGQFKPRLIIVLNDNKMSISPNVGAISKHLNLMVHGRPYIRLKEMIQNLLKSIPGVGKSMFEMAKKIEILARTMMVPGSLFDELGIKYIGPINGHDLPEMIKEFEEAKKYDFPVLLHVVTRKGEGFVPAEENPSSYHSSHPFDIQNGKFLKKEKTASYSEVFGRTVARLMASDARLIALTAAMPEGTGLDIIEKQFPDRFFDVGIAEQYLFDFAAGLSRGGLLPVIGIYSTFLQRAVDQVIHDISLMNLPRVVGIDRAGLVGGDGPTHQGIFDISLLLPVPRLVVAAPKDENELQNLIYTGTRLDKPMFIRYPKEPARGVSMDEELREIKPGTAEILRSGPDAVLIAVGPMAYDALKAADRLQRDANLSLTVVNARFLKPFDETMFTALAGTHKHWITIEDGSKVGGFGASIRQWLAGRNGIAHSLLILGLPDETVPLASRSQLLKLYQLDEEGMAGQIHSFLKGKSKKRKALKGTD